MQVVGNSLEASLRNSRVPGGPHSNPEFIQPLTTNMTVEDRLSLARDLRKRGNHAEALRLAQEACRSDPTNADAWWIAGLSSHSLKDLPAALQALHQTMKLLPRFASGFAQYGVVLAESGQLDAALRALAEAVRIDPKHLFALRHAARLSGEKKDGEGESRYRDLIAGLPEANADDLNAAGIMHWRRKHFFRALELYRASIRMGATEAPYFNMALVYNHVEVSQDLDACDALSRALEVNPGYEVAARRLAGITPKLKALIERVGKHRQMLGADRWFENYLSPLHLLRVEDAFAYDVDPKQLVRLRKELLQEIELEDGRISWLDGRIVDRSTAISVCDELNNPAKARHHWTVFADVQLVNFLQTGNIGFFLYSEEYSAAPTLTELEDDSSDFAEWLSKPFAKQFGLVLSEALQRGLVPVVEALFDGRRWVLPEDDDLCFAKAHIIVGGMLEPLRSAAESAKTRVPSAELIEKILGDGKIVEIFNLLPTHFREFQNEAVKLVRGIALSAYNEHGKIELSRQILEISRKFAFKDAEITAKLEDDFKQIEKLIQEENQHEAKLVNGKDAWEITKLGVKQGARFLAVDAIRSIRWGINDAGTQWSPKHEYLMVFRDDEGKEVSFSWSATQDLEKQQAHFTKLIQAAVAYITPVVIEKITATLDRGGTVRIGACALSRNGVAFDVQGWIFSKNHIVPWNDVGTEIRQGQLLVFSVSNPKTHATMPLKTTENAIALQFMAKGRS